MREGVPESQIIPQPETIFPLVIVSQASLLPGGREVFKIRTLWACS